MKLTFQRTTIVLILFLSLTAQALMAQQKNDNLTIDQISCEYAINPLGIENSSPRLSWQIASTKRGVKQKAYQVVVATSLEKLKDDIGDLWDAGKVMSSQSVQILYGGKPLHSRMRCYWKVRVWDENDNSSNYSPPGWFEIGLLDDSDWQAEWISPPHVYGWKLNANTVRAADWDDRTMDQLPAPYFRKSFVNKKTVKSARVYISGLGYYELYLNGKKVGDHVLDPAFTRYDKRVLYVTYDVTEYLNTGGNTLGIWLGNGWYNPTHQSVWGFDKAAWRNPPVVRCQMEIENNDGTKQVISTGTNWKVYASPIVYDNIFCGETYDARLEMPGWNNTDFEDANWATARTVEGPAGKPTAQTMPPVNVTNTIQPVSVTEPKPGYFVFDLGQNISGWPKLTIKGPVGARVTMKCGERLYEDGTVNNDDIKRFIREQEVQTDVYILKGEGEETWEPRFTYHGFQYIQVSGFPGIPTLGNVQGRSVSTSFASGGDFKCSEPLFNRIQEITRWSYQNNFLGYPTDCPQREKNGWTGDAHLAAEAGLFNFASASAYIKWLDDIKDEQQTSGELSAIIPTSGWGYFFGNGPAWDSAYPLIAWYLYLYCGDIQVLTTHYDNIKLYVDYLTEKANDGIISIGLGDWAPAKTKTPVEITSTGYYYIDAMIVSQSARLLGNNEDATAYAELAGKIRDAFNREFYDTKTGMYGGGSQTAQSCALYQGLVKNENKQKVVENLVRNVEQNQGHLDCGILGTKYLINSLAEHGRPDIAYTIASQTTFPGWGNWIKQGATTLWEQWDGSQSLNHIMFGDISAWFYKTLAGINPDPEMPGFKRIIIKPYFADGLTWVQASHNSMYGKIKCNWEKDKERILLKIDIPPNTTAIVYMPKTGLGEVREHGGGISKVKGVKFMDSEGNNLLFEVGSGQYIFESK